MERNYVYMLTCDISFNQTYLGIWIVIARKKKIKTRHIIIIIIIKISYENNLNNSHGKKLCVYAYM